VLGHATLRVVSDASCRPGQDLEDLEEAIRRANTDLKQFDSSCFNGVYVTGGITDAYLADLQEARNDAVRTGNKTTTGTRSDAPPVTVVEEKGPAKILAGACEPLFNDP
jgi:glucokinase